MRVTVCSTTRRILTINNVFIDSAMTNLHLVHIKQVGCACTPFTT